MRGAAKKDVVISIRIPDWLKEEMDSVNINWSEYIRQAIEKKIYKEKMKNLWKEIESLKDKFVGDKG